MPESPTSAPTFTITAIPTNTPSPTITVTLTTTPTITVTLTTTPTPTIQLPALEGTSLPKRQASISKTNIEQLAYVARWGDGEFIDYSYDREMKKIIVVSGAKINCYDSDQETKIWSKESLVFKATLSNNGKLLAVVTPTGIELWNAENGDFIKSLYQAKSIICPTGCRNSYLLSNEISVEQLDFSPNDQLLGAQITGLQEDGNNNRALFWSMPLGEELPAIVGRSFNFSPDSSLVAVSVNNDTVNIIKTSDWELTLVLNSPKVHFSVEHHPLVFSPDNSLFTTAQWSSNEIFVWDMKNGQVIRKIGILSYRLIDFINSDEILIVDKSGNRFVNVYSGKQTKLPGEKSRFSFGTYTVFDRVLRFSDDKQYVAIGVIQDQSSLRNAIAHTIKEIQIWDLNQSTVVQTFMVGDVILMCRFSTDQALFSCVLGKKFIEWDVQTGQIIKEILLPVTQKSSNASLSPDGTLIQTDNDVIEIDSGKTIFSSPDCCLGFSPNNIPIKLVETDRTIKIVNAQTDETISIIETAPKTSTYYLSPSGSYLGIENGIHSNIKHNRIIKFWNINNGKLMSSIGGGDKRFVFSFSPDESLIAIGYPNRTAVNFPGSVVIQDVFGKLITKLEGVFVTGGLAFSSDNKFLAISGYENIAILEISDSRVIGTADTLLPCESLTFSPNSDLLFCGNEIGVIQVFSVPEMSTIHQFHAHSLSVTSLWLSPDGTLLGSGSSDGVTKLWAIWP